MHKSSILDIYTCSVRVCDIVREMCVCIALRTSHFTRGRSWSPTSAKSRKLEVTLRVYGRCGGLWFGASATAECLKICGGCDSCRDELACELLCVVLVLRFVLVCLHEQ